MHKLFESSSSFWLLCLLLICAMSVVSPAMANSKPAELLLEKFASLEEQLHQNQFKRPVVLDSAETFNGLKGDIYATVDYPFTEVSAGLNNADHWCDVMLLHTNTKYCYAVVVPSGTTLLVNVGRKTPEEIADAARITLTYNVALVTPEYLEIILTAKKGPLSTSDYTILLEAVALPNAKTFVHLTYSYTMNFIGRLAMQTYLGTLGRGKVGFTVTGQRPDGQLDYIGGVRGLVERNTMRYYLAIDAFLGAASKEPSLQFEQRMQSWFTAVEQYPRQLHELDREKYVEMKRAENLRQQTLY
jgi:hypothetical protein